MHFAFFFITAALIYFSFLLFNIKKNKLKQIKLGNVLLKECNNTILNEKKGRISKEIK